MEKIKQLIEEGTLSIGEILEYAQWYEQKADEYYENQYPNYPEDCQDTMDEERQLRDAMMAAEDMYGHELDQEMELSRSDNPEYIIASTSYKMDETYIFECNEDGEIHDFSEYGGLALRWGNEDWTNYTLAVENTFGKDKYEFVKKIYISPMIVHTLFKRINIINL